MMSTVSSRQRQKTLEFKRGQLCEAIEAGDDSMVRELLADGLLDLNSPLTNDCTPLIQAIQQGRNSVVKVLLELGADVSQGHTVQCRTLWSGATGNSRKVYPLAAAVQKGSAYIIQLLLSKGAPLEHCKGGLQSLFSLAVRLDCENLVKLLLFMGKKQEQETGLLLTTIDLGEPLMAAVTLQKFSIARLLLDLGADANRESGGMLPLVAAANNGDPAMCSLLLDNGATLGRTTGSLASSHTPLSSAIMAGLEHAVTVLIELGSDVNMVTDLGVTYPSVSRSVTGGRTMLHHAAVKNNLAIAKKLVEAGCAINCEDSKGNTPLHIVCTDRSGQLGLVKYLLELAQDTTLPPERVPNINAKNLQGHTPLMIAVSSRNTDIADLLVQAGADLELRDKQQFSALHHAVQRGSDVLVLKLLRSGAGVNGYKKKAPTPLHEAVRNNDYTIVDILLENKADVNHPTALKETPMHLAVQSRGEDLVEYFINLGLDINAKTQGGETPLMVAARQDTPDICELLIASGANMDYHDHNQQETALLLSVYFGFEENAKLLIAHGADLNATDKRNNNGIYWSIFNARIQSLLFLIMAGAHFNKHTIFNTPQNTTVRRNEHLNRWMWKMVREVRPLQDLCRLAIRSSLKRSTPGRDILQHVQGLSLPGKMKDYLGYRTTELEETVEYMSPGLGVRHTPSPVSDNDN